MNIYVGNLSYNTRDGDLHEIFSQFGEVTSAKVLMDKMTGRSKGFGFVEMPNQEEAVNAINGTNEREFDGRNLRVNESQPKPAGDRGGYAPRGPAGAGRGDSRPPRRF